LNPGRGSDRFREEIDRISRADAHIPCGVGDIPDIGMFWSGNNGSKKKPTYSRLEHVGFAMLGTGGPADRGG
ncbi:MAG: hypothetical protein VW582_02490, partial [Rhodospirillaceae bacterium]